MTQRQLKDFLDEKCDFYNAPHFIESDPISIPHRFSKKEDIEISAFFAAIFAWGQRITIIKKANELLAKMDNSPYDFIQNHLEKDRLSFKDFKHRTFNFDDLNYFLKSLQSIYKNYGGLEQVFLFHKNDVNSKNAIVHFRSTFFKKEHLRRTEKHVSSPLSNSACKRLNMFLRWMVRKDNRGVDFGIWQNARPTQLCCPLDVHSGRVARKLGLLKRKQNDWRAVEELDTKLRQLDPFDPVKYDFALFGLGVFEKF